jgi:hypothetical protein
LEIGKGILSVALKDEVFWCDAVSIGEELSAFRNVGKDLPIEARLKSQIRMFKNHIAEDLGGSAAG